MITIQLTEAEAARICYALAAEANDHNRKMCDERRNGSLSAASGRIEIIHESARNECLGIVRKLEEEIHG